jgi:phage terminase large subunit
MTTAIIKLPPKIVANFAQPSRHRVFKGGRGSAKTRSLALMSAIKVFELAQQGREGVWLCSREHLNSLSESSFEEIRQAIISVDWLANYFDIGERYIRTQNRRIEFAFAGLRVNLDSIKSKARILGNWTDEAENVSEAAWRKLIPTIREEGSENWVSYNPESEHSATHKRFIENPPTDCVTTEINWRDNPWFPDVLNLERLDDQRLRPEVYEHVWEGGFLTITDAQIFSGKYDIAEFEPGKDWHGPYFGMDFGFSQDPTVATEWWVHDSRLYCRHEAGRVKLELDDTAQYFAQRIPNISMSAIRADSARPESISYLKRYGLPRITGVKKWAGSVEDGIAHMKSYDKIVIHPDCPETAREFRLYSYKVDRLSGDVLTTIMDANNHFIDSARYAIAPLIKQRGMPQVRAL